MSADSKGQPVSSSCPQLGQADANSRRSWIRAMIPNSLVLLLQYVLYLFTILFLGYAYIGFPSMLQDAGKWIDLHWSPSYPSTVPAVTYSRHALAVANRTVLHPAQQLPTSRRFMTGMNGLTCDETDYPKEKSWSQLWQLARRYAQFHSDGVKDLQHGRSHLVKTLTWYCGENGKPCGGLGYRFQGMVVSWFLAMLTNRVVLLKWNDVSVENTYLVPNMINWTHPGHKFHGSTIDVGDFYPYTLKTLEAYHLKMLRVLTSNAKHVELHYNLLKHLNKLVELLVHRFKLNMPRNLPRQFSVPMVQSVGMLSLFRFSEEIRTVAKDMRYRVFTETLGAKYVALHLRTGLFKDGLKETGPRYQSSKTVWSSAAECAIKQSRRQGMNLPVVIVSDSDEAKEWITHRYPQVISFKNKIIHIDKRSNIDEAGMLGIWQDIFIMAEAYTVVRYVSTFSDVSVALCAIPPSRVVDYFHCNSVK